MINTLVETVFHFHSTVLAHQELYKTKQQKWGQCGVKLG